MGFIALSLTYDLISPPFENPDEINHAEYAAFIAEHGRLPHLLTDCVRLSFHPPLYHALMAPIAWATHVDTEDVMVNHRLNPDYQSSHVILLHDDPEETFPYSGRSRFVHIARAMTVLLGAVVLIYTHKLVHLLTSDAGAALVATVTVAAIPQLQYISASVNHDAMAAALAAAFIYYAVLLVHAPSLLLGVLAGAVLGAALLVKSSLLVLSPLPFALWLIHTNRQHARVAPVVITSYAVAVTIAGWWYVSKQCSGVTCFRLCVSAKARGLATT
ncbi:MAG: glycosyltransferase family 39 protein [Deltaproteobacteria bacterium]|nr:glycosyltransferase family 39 protein [Deltaproteobacteria bacterium]